jgi:hypothetical protein
LREAVYWAPGLTNSFILEFFNSSDSPVNDISLQPIINVVLKQREQRDSSLPPIPPLASVVVPPELGGLGQSESNMSLMAVETAAERGNGGGCYGPMDTSSYLAELRQRSSYIGKVSGMFNILRTMFDRDELVHQKLSESLCKNLENSLAASNKMDVEEQIFLATAYIIYSKSNY